jgi:hypothetical protein
MKYLIQGETRVAVHCCGQQYWISTKGLATACAGNFLRLTSEPAWTTDLQRQNYILVEASTARIPWHESEGGVPEKFGYTKYRDEKPFPILCTRKWGPGGASGDAPGITTCVSETGPRQDMGFLFQGSISVCAGQMSKLKETTD